MADGDTEVEWVVAKHVRFPLPWDVVIGRYPSELDAQKALDAVRDHAQWFTTYSCEKRVKGG